jgi:hypothetical protein
MKTALFIIQIVAFLALIGSLILFFTGSLEEFPGAEQTASARLVWGLISGLFLVILLVSFKVRSLLK